MIELEPDVLIASVYGGYVVELRIGDRAFFHSVTSLSQAWRLIKAHMELLEATKDDEPVEVAIEDE